MKIKHLFTAAVLAIATIAAPAAQAFSAYNYGDLLLGFRQVGNATNTDYVINIGSGEIYRDALAPITFSLTNVNTALAAKFGSGWETDSNVYFGIFGTVRNTPPDGTEPIGLYYVTQAAGSAGPSQIVDNSTIANAMNSLKDYYRSRTEIGTTNASYGATGNANSFTTRASQKFSGGSVLNAIDTQVTNTNGLELYRVPQTADGAISDEGTFSISGNSLTFTPTTAVPEPSTYAFMFLGTIGFAYIAVRYFRGVKA